MSIWQPADGDFMMSQYDASEVSELHTEAAFQSAA